MAWPMSQDFNEAMQSPRLAFTDLDLKTGETVVGAHGIPLPRSGNFADVYQVRGTDGGEWAVKCFTRPVTGLEERYAAVSEALAAADFPFSVGFEFLAEGIRVAGVWRPVVKMEWVEGLLLNQVVRDNATRPAVLAALGQMWVKLCKRLREVGVAHADLQHGNVLLVPGSRPGAYGLKLIDYDGMYVPALANTPSGETGHPAYQHPARVGTQAYSPDVDRFPYLVVATALKGLAVCGAALWERYDNGDNLLFTEQDFRKPAVSKLMRELWRTEDPAVQAFVGRLAVACVRPIPQTPWLDQLAPDGDPAPLDESTRREAAATLGIALPVPTSPPLELPVERPKPQAPKSQSAKQVPHGDSDTEHPRSNAGRRTRKRLGLPLIAFLAIAVTAGVVGAIIKFRPQPQPLSHEVVEIDHDLGHSVAPPGKPNPARPVVVPKTGEIGKVVVPPSKPEPTPPVVVPKVVDVRPIRTEDDAVAFVQNLGGVVIRNESLPGKPVVAVNLVQNAGVTDIGLKELTPLKSLTSLNLYRTRVTDLGLKELVPLRSLTTLDLTGTKVTDAGLKELAALADLAILDLTGTGITDSGLKELARLKNLATLDLTGTKVTDAGLKELAALTRLTTLDLANSKVTNAGLKELAALTQLRTLGLGGTGVTDAGLKELAALTQLTTLTLGGPGVTDAGLKDLAGLTKLTTLYLGGTGVTDVGLKDLAPLRNLTTLYLSFTHVTDTGLKELTRHPDLTTLHLSGTKVTDAGLKELAGLKNLTSLNLSYTKVTDAGVRDLHEALPKCKIDR